MSDREFNGNNPSWEPEKCGLETVDSISGDLSYEFSEVYVWRDLETGKLYWDYDSGCSCPSPFEDVRRLSDLSELNEDNWHNFTESVNEIHSDTNMDEEKSRFIGEMRQLLK